MELQRRSKRQIEVEESIGHIGRPRFAFVMGEQLCAWWISKYRAVLKMVDISYERESEIFKISNVRPVGLFAMAHPQILQLPPPSNTACIGVLTSASPPTRLLTLSLPFNCVGDLRPRKPG